MHLCSALERPLRSTTAARRISRADRGLPHHSSCSRSLPRNRLSCSATRASERCDSMAPSSAWCCKTRAGTLQRPGATRADAAPSAHDMRNMARCACEGGEGSCSGVRWRNTRRARGTFPLRAQTPRTRKNKSIAVQRQDTAALGGSGSPSPCHAACPTQAEGSWPGYSSVSLGLCRTQATSWHVAATGTLLPSCENQREIKCSVTTVEMEEIQHN